MQRWSFQEGFRALFLLVLLVVFYSVLGSLWILLVSLFLFWLVILAWEMRLDAKFSSLLLYVISPPSCLSATYAPKCHLTTKTNVKLNFFGVGCLSFSSEFSLITRKNKRVECLLSLLGRVVIPLYHHALARCHLISLTCVI